MSTPAAPVVQAPKLTAIQQIENQIKTFLQQREQAVANVHAVDGAVQGAQLILSTLKAEEAKAAAVVAADAPKVESEVRSAVKAVLEDAASKVIDFETAVKNKA